MEKNIIPTFTTLLLLELLLLLSLCSNPANAAGKAPAAASPTPTPAPAPAPDYVNLTDLLSVAGPFHTFLNYLQSTKVLDTFQNQANNTEEGITIFVPTDDAFSSLKTPSLKNLTQDQLKQLCLFHALPHYYSLSEFKNLSDMSPVSTFAGAGEYSLNFTDKSGTVHVGSGWTNTKISSSVISTDPVAVYEVSKVLLPEAIFGTDIPPMAAPAPAPDKSSAPDADAPAADGASGKSGEGPSSAKSTSGGCRMVGSLNPLVLGAVVGGVGSFFFFL